MQPTSALSKPVVTNFASESQPSNIPRPGGFPFFTRPLALAIALFFQCASVRGEAMLQLFNVNWDELIQKMPEIAEAGYTSLWLPPPAKAGSVYSVGSGIH